MFPFFILVVVFVTLQSVSAGIPNKIYGVNLGSW